MAELTNLKHERFARAVIESPSYAKAYAKVYDQPDPKLASDCASRLLSENVGVRNRIQELLNKQGCGINRIVERFNDFLNDDTEKSLSWDAVKTGFKLFGAFDTEDSAKNMNQVHISIVQISNNQDTQHPSNPCATTVSEVYDAT